MRKTIIAAVFLTAVLLVTLAAGLCYAQSPSTTGTILGTVLDPQGAAVPKATVVAKNLDTGIERTTTTTSDGLYRIPNLSPGVYEIRVEATGFAKAEAKGVKLQVGDQQDVNFKLALAGVTEVVRVTAEAPLIQSTKTDVSVTVNDSDMARLPVTNSLGTSVFGSNINDFASLAATAPGVRIDLTTVSNDLIGPGQFNDRNNLINIDGGNIIDQVDSGRDAIGASVDEIKEFQVLTNNYNAEYGQAGGIIINAITKSGTNSIHGDFHFFARGRNLQASNLFYNQSLSTSASSSMPLCPTNTVNGVLTKIDGCPRAHFFKHETGFTLGGPFVKNKTFWFVSYEKLLQGSPLTLTPPSGAVTVNQPDDEVMWSAKIDHELTSKHHLTARFNAQRVTLDNILTQITQSSSPDALTADVNHDHTLNMSLTSKFSPHLVNEARVFWHRFLNLLDTKSTQPGLKGPNFYLHAAFCCPQGAPAPGQNRYQGIDNLTWIRGTHTVKTGVNFSYFTYFSSFPQSHFGVWTHGGAETPGGGNPPTGLLGANPPTDFTIGLGQGAVLSKDNIYGWYVQDTWKIRPNFTLNYGLRWDYEAGAFKGGTIPAPGGGCFQLNGIIPACSEDKNNFQPRVGIAWGPRFQSGPLRAIFGAPDKSLITASFAEVTELAFLNVVLDSLNFDGVNVSTLSISPSDPCGPSVFSSWPNRPSDSVLAPCIGPSFFGKVRPISSRLKNPEVRHVNLSFQREFLPSLVLNVQYVGAFGFGQFGERDTNFPPVIADPAHPGFFFFGDRPDPRFTAVRTNENSRTSQYNGLIVEVTKRMAHHFQVHGGYTWSHTISSTEDFFGVSEPGDPRNIRAERTDAQADIRHMANIGAVIDTEKLTSRSGLRWLFNDWSFGIFTQLQSGRPWPISTGDVPFANATFFGIGNESFQRPSVLPDGSITTAGIADAFAGFPSGFGNYLISPNAVAACQASGQPVCPTANTFLAPATASPLGAVDAYTGEIVDFQLVNGNLKRNAGRTTPFYRIDLSVTRSFRVPWRENTRVELRADFFNILNRANFVGFNSAPNTSQFTLPAFTNSDGTLNTSFANCTGCVNPITGKLIGTNGQVLTLSALRHGRVSPDLTNPIFLGMGDPTATDIPRQIQLSIRVRF